MLEITNEPLSFLIRQPERASYRIVEEADTWQLTEI
jgi:hypothetical protein